jgi:hypothetical protein
MPIAFPLFAALLAAILLPTSASAHVKWFAPYDVTQHHCLSAVC